jgi:hypothetical protein
MKRTQLLQEIRKMRFEEALMVDPEVFDTGRSCSAVGCL